MRKEKGVYDILTFTGIWEINKNNQIIYRYEEARLIRKKSRVHTLTFKGCWDIKDRLRISYALGAGTDSIFNFSASAGIFKDGYIKYELGVGSAMDISSGLRTITLFGEWKLKKDTGLVFEVECEGRKGNAIVFGADVKLTDRDTIIFRLKNDIENKDIDATLELSHKIMEGDGEIFLRALSSRRESAIYAGAAWRW